jgi:hypothetical protein
MARPKASDEPRKVKSVRLPISTLEALKRAAKDRGLSENHLVEWAISEHLVRLDRENQQPRLDLWPSDVPSEAS